MASITVISAAAVCFVPALVLYLLGGYEWYAFGLFFAAFAAAGWSVVRNVIQNFPRIFRGGFHPMVLFDENFLMLIAAVGAFAINEPMEGAAVMLLYQIGELLQSIAVGSSRGAIAKLMEMKSDTAVRLNGDGQEEIDPEELAAGDLILLRKGDKVPADCILTEGKTSFDVKSLTGESVPREVQEGEEMLAGAVNLGNAVKAKVLRPVSESAVQKILDMVENSSEKKAKPEKFITKFARIYTPVVVLLAVLIAVIPPLFDGYDFVKWIVPALEFLVISCPCAIVISVPLTYFSGVGALARIGVLAKGAVCLDSLAKVKVAAFDKTGTLTEGKFYVGKADERALLLAAAVEMSSSHPLAQAFRDTKTPFEATDVEEVAGMGLRAVVDGKAVIVGSERFLRAEGVEFEPSKSLSSVIYVTEDGKYDGCVEIDDRLRADARETLSGLKRAGIRKIAVLTGDSKARADSLAGLPVDEIHAELLPADKLACAEDLKREGALLYAGDGINDTPVMAASDVAVAMGGLGSDAAIEASDFVLAGDSLSALPKAIRCAKKTRRIVVENIVFSVSVKVVLMALSVIAVATSAFSLPIWAAVFGDVGVMLLAVLNSMRMRAKLR